MRGIVSLFALVLFVLPAFSADAADRYTVTGSGGNETITEHTVCREVTNDNAASIMVPTKTKPEWCSFIDNTPSNVALGACSGGGGGSSPADVYCWGNNAYGGLGDGTKTHRSSPTLVSGGHKWEQTSSAVTFSSCGITAEGDAYCWGSNLWGNLGDGTTTESLTPVLVSGGYEWASIDTGGLYTCGLTTGGAAYCWGSNTYGGVGDGTTTNRHSPTLVSGGHTWKLIKVGAAFNGSLTCGITTNDDVYCWGRNIYGQVGDGTTTQRNSPTLVSGGHKWASITFKLDSTCGITTGGDAYCWGSNEWGILGDSTTTNRSTPTLVSGGHTWQSIRTDHNLTCGINTGGTAYCWGRNTYGALGDGTTTDRHSPTLVSGGHSWLSLLSSYLGGCGLTTGEKIYCWGRNTDGGVGDGTTTDRHSPTLIVGGHDWQSLVMSPLNRTHYCAVTTGEELYCWGQNTNGEVGDGTTTNPRTSPTLVDGGHTWDVSKLVLGPGTCGKLKASNAYCWGRNMYGQVGDGTTTDRLVPTSIGTYDWSYLVSNDANNFCGIMSNGNGYCWGNNGSGALGDGTTINRSTPTLISGGHKWKSLNVWFWQSCGITTDDDAYCWGYNAFGNIGDGTTTSRNSPTLVSGGYKWKKIETQGSFSTSITCGITTNDDAYCWGDNAQGRIGDGTITDRLTPTLVSGGHKWSTIIPGFSASNYTNCGITMAGVAYCWGDGPVGDGTTTDRLIPTPVSGGHTWQSITTKMGTTCGLATSGAAYCWGSNTHGAIGDGTTTNRHSPTLVSGGHTWQDIVGGFVNVCGLTTGGDIYCWGDNNEGNIGDGTTIDRPSPTLVSGGYTWQSVYSGGNLYNCGKATSGELYCWGYNSNGQLGDGTTTNRSTPTLALGGHKWSIGSFRTTVHCGLLDTGAAAGGTCP